MAPKKRTGPAGNWAGNVGDWAVAGVAAEWVLNVSLSTRDGRRTFALVRPLVACNINCGCYLFNRRKKEIEKSEERRL